MLGQTENVVEFLVTDLERLPENTLRTINWGACFGNSFDIRLLSGSMSIPISTAENDLWVALRAGKKMAGKLFKRC